MLRLPRESFRDRHEASISGRGVLRLLVTAVLFILVQSTWVQNASAQKTDQVVFYRGDVITGTIKGLSRGRLDYSTDDLQRVSIEWEKVARIKSTHRFDVELTNATDYVGFIENGDNDGEMVIVTETQRVYVRMPQVVRITPLGSSFLSKIDGKINLGFDITRANNQKIWNTAGRLTFRSIIWKSSIDASSYVNSQDSLATVFRNTVTYDAQRFIAGTSWSILGSVTAEQNDELNLEHRFTALLSAGNFFIRTNRMILQVLAGAATTNELFTGQESNTQNLESLLGLKYEMFQFANPEIDFSAQLQVFVSLSDFGRVRPEFNSSLSWEVFKNFDIGLRGYVQGDSNPGEGARNVDYALTTTLG
ncbi:MAG: DUF481 domain-containing protein, partial [Rhodothermia bacterium]